MTMNAIAIFITVLLTHDISYAKQFTSEECTQREGIVASSCVDGESIGDVIGLRCKCVCCVGEKRFDCKEHGVRFSNVCATPGALKFDAEFIGEKIPKSVSLDLKAEAWRGGMSVPIKARKATYEIAYKGAQQNRNFKWITGYRLFFAKTLPDSCSFDGPTQQQIAIPECSQK